MGRGWGGGRKGSGGGEGRSDVGVVAEFFGDGGGGAVAGVDCGCRGEFQNFGVDAADEGGVVAAGEVGAADAALEKDVAGKDEVRIGDVVQQAACGMAGGFQRHDFLISETERCFLVDEDIDVERTDFNRQMEHLGLLLAALSEVFVVAVGVDFRAVAFAGVIHAEGVVDVDVGQQYRLDYELVVGDEAVDNIFLGAI